MRACASLGRLNQNVSDAVKVRQEVDLRIGNTLTVLTAVTLILHLVVGNLSLILRDVHKSFLFENGDHWKRVKLVIL